jgi:hypothetical protein
MSKLAHSNDDFMKILEELDYMGEPEMTEPAYKIVRFYRHDKPACTIKTGLTLEQAQAHCRDETTSTPDFFDGYENAFKEKAEDAT